MTVQTWTSTADDLARLPDDGWRYELVRGEIRKAPPAGHEHGRIGGNIVASIGHHIRQRKLGPVFLAQTGFLLARDLDTVRAPDLAFVAQERAQTPTSQHGYWPGAPDLAVEVISPSDSYAEVEEKVVDWLTAGARLVLVINPRARRVTAYRPGNQIQVYTDTDMLDAGELAPGWTMAAPDIFA